MLFILVRVNEDEYDLHIGPYLMLRKVSVFCDTLHQICLHSFRALCSHATDGGIHGGVV